MVHMYIFTNVHILLNTHAFLTQVSKFIWMHVNLVNNIHVTAKLNLKKPLIYFQLMYFQNSPLGFKLASYSSKPRLL